MSDLAGVKNFIDVTDVDYKSAISEALVQKIAASINWLQQNNNNQYTLGDYVWSFLDTAPFQAIYGVGFVKATGQSISGSDLDNTYGISTLPDMRAQFIRGLDNGAGVDSGRVMATTQAGQNASHEHFLLRNGASVDTSGVTNSLNNTSRPTWAEETTAAPSGRLEAGGADFASNVGLSSTNGVTGGRAKNVSMYLYVKVNN